VLIFVNDVRRVSIVVEKLADVGIIAAPLSGGEFSSKMDRRDVTKLFRDGKIGCVVATEMAARGIDAPDLTHVINLDLPTDASHYIHRSGRCGRGGRPGVVVNIAAGGKEHGAVDRFAETLKIPLYEVDLREGEMRIMDKQKKQ